MYIKYAFMAVFSLLLTVAALILAPILPLFIKHVEGPLDNGTRYGIGPRLPQWMSWLMTPDNSLEGDYGWKVQHWQWRFKLPALLATYAGYVGWLWRNPAYAFGMQYINGYATPLRVSGDNTIGDNATAKEGSLLVTTPDLFQYVYVKRIGSTNKCLYVNLGWNIRALIDANNRSDHYRATFVFSPRISGFNPQ